MGDMKFTEYEKMSDSIGKFIWSKDFENTDWVVTEKIHGANFSFHTDGKEVKIARRRAFLENNESFFNYQNAEFMTTYPERVKGVFEMVQNLKEGINIGQVTVFCELFGGIYSHPDLESDQPRNRRKQKPVQQEIEYSPKIECFAYDIAYRTYVGERLGHHEYIDYADAMKIFDDVGILYPKPLFIGKANEAANYDIKFDSAIPKQLGLPPLPKGTNSVEGIVVKPLKNIMAKTLRDDELIRAIIKIKAPEFDETRNQKGNKQKGTQKRQSGTDSGVKPKRNVSGRPDKALMPIMMKFVTDNRMVSAISKIGQPETEDIEKKIEEEFISDVFADLFEADERNEPLWEACDQNQKDIVMRSLRAKTQAMIQRYKKKVMNNGSDTE